MDQQQSRVKHFLKLGYSYSDIQRVLRSLQHDAQNNDILEELIKTCRTTGSCHMGAERAPGSSPQLVPRGCSSPQQHADPQGGHHQHGAPDVPASSCFRPVVIDGSNVAISHGNKQVFSCRGIQLVVQWFWDRGVRDITVFVPSWRKEQSRPKAPITDQHILSELERKNILVYTPSRCIKGKRVVCYYGCYIVKLAYDSDGIIVSNDNYYDLQEEKPQWKKFIEDRLLMYTFANDMFMPPDDPLGRNGPTIENFLRKKPAGSASKQQHCPYGRKCTYGVKCKFYHPERSKQPQLSVADELRAKSQPASDTKEFLNLSYDSFSNTSPRYATTTNENPQHTTSKNAATLFSASQEEMAYLQGDLYLSYSPEDVTKRPAYLQRSLPALCKSDESNQACGSLEFSMSRLHLSDSALQTSLACSSGCGSDSSYSLSDSWNTGHRRALSPEWACGYSPGTATLSHCQHTHSDLSLSYTHTPHPLQRCKPQCPYSRLMPSHYEEPLLFHGSSIHHASYSRLPEVSWGQVQARDREGHEQTTDRRKDVRSQLSTIFPQNIVDQVMNLYPHMLDTTELIALIIKCKNSQIL